MAQDSKAYLSLLILFPPKSPRAHISPMYVCKIAEQTQTIRAFPPWVYFLEQSLQHFLFFGFLLSPDHEISLFGYLNLLYKAICKIWEVYNFLYIRSLKIKVKNTWSWKRPLERWVRWQAWAQVSCSLLNVTRLVLVATGELVSLVLELVFYFSLDSLFYPFCWTFWVSQTVTVIHWFSQLSNAIAFSVNFIFIKNLEYTCLKNFRPSKITYVYWPALYFYLDSLIYWNEIHTAIMISKFVLLTTGQSSKSRDEFWGQRIVTLFLADREGTLLVSQTKPSSMT